MVSIEQQLAAPFAASDIEWRVQSEIRKGAAVRVLAYVTNRAIMQRLDEVFGTFGWQNEFAPGPCGGIVCRLKVRNPETGEWVVKEDGAENTDIEAVKGGLSSAMKRTAVQLGIGRYLYNLGETSCRLKDNGEHWHKVKKGPSAGAYKYWDTPQLPPWALPPTAGPSEAGADHRWLADIQDAGNIRDLDELVEGVRSDSNLNEKQVAKLMKAADFRFKELHK